MGWNISPTDASIDNNGHARFPRNTSNKSKSYTVTYTDDVGYSERKTYRIPPCTVVCECSDLTITPSSTLSRDGGNNVTIGTISMVDCMSSPTVTSSESWLSNLSVSGTDIKANVSSNQSSERSSNVTVTVNTVDGDTCDNTMSVTQASCPYPDDTIPILLYRATIPHHCTFFVLLDSPISDSDKDWIIESGYKFYPPASLTEDINIGEYIYENCEVGNFATNCQYCSIKNGMHSNKKLEVGKKYYWYYYLSSSNQWVDNHKFVLPTEEYCQEHVNRYCHCCYVIYET